MNEIFGERKILASKPPGTLPGRPCVELKILASKPPGTLPGRPRVELKIFGYKRVCIPCVAKLVSIDIWPHDDDFRFYHFCLLPH